MPRPTLAQESGQKRGCLGEGCFSLTPKSRGGDANSITAELSAGLGTGLGGWFGTRAGYSYAVSALCHATLPCPPSPTAARFGVGAWLKGGSQSPSLGPGQERGVAHWTPLLGI